MRTVIVRHALTIAVGVAALATAGAANLHAQPSSFESPTRVPTNIEALTHLMESRDPVKFLNQRAKPLKLSDVQRDSLKKLEQGLKRLRTPLLRRLERELPESLLPGPQTEIASLPTVIRVLVDSLVRSTDNYGQMAWAQLDDSQRAQALELRANWKPDVYTPPTRRAFQVRQIGGPP